MKNKKVSYLCLCNLLGIILGLTVGRIIFNNPGAGLCFSAGLGMVIGSIIDNREKKRNSKGLQDNVESEEKK